MSEENIFDNVQSITYHFSKDGLLIDWREEALRHREEIEKLKEQNKTLKEAVKEKAIATCNACEDYGICPHSYREFDLDNIINNFDKWLEEQLMYFNDNNGTGGFSTNIEDLEIVKEKLQELKGEDKE